jgi:hypothetical protein
MSITVSFNDLKETFRKETSPPRNRIQHTSPLYNKNSCPFPNTAKTEEIISITKPKQPIFKISFLNNSPEILRIN